MCGIAGYLYPQTLRSEDGATLERMTRSLAHRGPDHGSTWISKEHGIGLGHRRLAIVDLSPQGQQPMHSHCDRYAIVFNGEIYNHIQLRQELSRQGAQFNGHSDTEVMLEAIAQWGLTSALSRFVGMFAFSLWDKKEQQLYLARDRLGIKPLYYGWLGQTFVFASELKAIKAHPQFDASINHDALLHYFALSYIPAPLSIYTNIYKLKPGTWLRVSASSPGTTTAETYWDLPSIAQSGQTNPLDEDTVIYQLNELLENAIVSRMHADVPLGSFLSGGIDSALVTTIMQKHSTKPIQTFTIGFNEEHYNEAPFAHGIARHLGTQHHEIYITGHQALQLIPQLNQIYDEPFADISQIPTFFVSQLAERSVKVVLSGDGGDEVFGGYNRYLWGEKLWQRSQQLPNWIKQNLEYCFNKIPQQVWKPFFQITNKLLPTRMRLTQDSNKLAKLIRAINSKSHDDLYYQLITTGYPLPQLLHEGEQPTLKFIDSLSPQTSFAAFMMLNDMRGYLPDDVLCKVDRASMANSIEVRTPLLDHRLIEFAWHIPTNLKIRHGQTKWLLRQYLFKQLPKSLFDRPKMGFTVPLDKWLRQDLRDWAEDLLSERQLKYNPYLNSQTVRNLWCDYQAGKSYHQHLLWTILLFQAWLTEQ
ncbi:MAG: asparagine synthase (glutamine-hydrolyzing) [Gammaproteobacteria bacterium]